MNLLLLLSALLSALSGVSGSARVAPAAATVARVAPALIAREVRVATAAGRLMTGLPRLSGVVSIGLRAGWRLVPAVPLFAGRRRE